MQVLAQIGDELSGLRAVGFRFGFRVELGGLTVSARRSSKIRLLTTTMKT